MTRVLILGDERKGGTAEVVGRFESWLRSRVEEVEVVLDRDAPIDQVAADLVCVFGGDGSILAAARRMGRNQIPTLGINLGRLGFLTACGPSRAEEATEAALAGEMYEEERAMLECTVLQPGGRETDPVFVLNDGVLNRRATASMVRIVALRGDDELATYSGDGVILSTPTGSTAYSLAAGGPVLAPDVDAVVLTPLASHSLALRPLVVALGKGLDLLVQEGGGASSCTLVLDGQTSMSVAVGDRVRVRPTDVKFRHLTWRADSFFEVFREKFGWSDVPRRPAAPVPDPRSQGDRAE